MSGAVLSSRRVEAIFMDCLFKKGENINNPVVAEGITLSVGFHAGRLSQHKAEIEGMLEELPEVFMKNSGGGMSFLNACQDKHGNQWTGLHLHMEQLFQLGLAIDKVEVPFPREMWRVLPGGVPYYAVK